MRRLCSLLGMPQNRFASVHIVGTNGKTSVARMTMALLEANGVRAGAYVSPHIGSWRERILIRGEPIAEDAFVHVLERAEQSAQVADRAAGDEGPVTQFELVTAAAFLAFAEARIEVAAIEAGLGGRLDATNVIPSKVTVLTSVGLDHTEWLGDTVEKIAAEKLAVLRDHTALIVGGVPEEVVPLVNREAEAHRVEPVYVPPAGGYPERNARAAGAAVSVALERDVAPESVLIPGRAELVAGDPPVIFDAAHNPDGAAALAELLPELTDGGEVVCCLAVLKEKDAAGIVGPLAEVCSRFVCTQIPEEAIRGSGRPVGESHSAEQLVDVCRAAGAMAQAVPDPVDAWRTARELARERGGAALAAGSHYLLSCIWTERPDPSF
jgi:dihydrofolate synthase/folylpolyglutamate synthase